ncbi:tetratricopeptide repeat protein [Methanococcoides alaskense]|nr:tetratricopeptide repeat protein [Methanococcoides alaskense]MDA0524174.1 tetratricopeptide repeat protein [Methanococcoides alaskense]
MSQRSKDMALRNFKKGMSLLDAGQQKDALELLLVAEKQAKDADSIDLLINTLQSVAEIMESRGEIDAALERYMEASELLDDLAKSDPTFVEHKALAMNKVATLLVNKGDTEHAGPFFEETIKAYDKLLSKEPNNVVNCSSASSALNDAATILAEIGQQKDAKERFERALKLSTKLIVLDPLNNSNGIKALTIQTNLANLLYDMGILEDARMNFESAYGGYSGLLKNDTSDNLFRDHLVDILDKQVHVLLDMQEYDASSKKLHELLDMLQSLAKDEPRFLERITDSIFGLVNLARDNADRGMLADARSRYEFTLTVLMDLIQDEPDYAIFLPTVRTILTDLESLLETDNDVSEKEADLNILISMYEKLSTLDTSDLSYATKISELNDRMVHLLIGAGRLDDVRAKAALTLDDLMDLIQEDPKNVNLLSMIREMLDDLESLLDTDRDVNEHKSNLNTLIYMYENLSDIYPSDVSYVTKISDLDNCMIRHLINSGRLDDARSRSDSTLDVLMDLVQKEPDNVTFLSMIHTIINDMESLLETDMDASKQESNLNALISMYEMLSNIDPSDFSHHVKIAELNERMGRFLMNAGRLDDARSRYSSTLNVLTKLIKEEPDNTNFLSIFRTIVNDMEALFEMNDDESEKGSDLNVLISIYENLSILDPSDLSHHVKIAELNERVGNLLMNAGRLDAARAKYDSALTVLMDLIQEDPDNVTFHSMFRILLADMEHLLEVDCADSEKEFDINVLISMYEKLSQLYPSDLSHYVKIAELDHRMGNILMNAGRLSASRSKYESTLNDLIKLIQKEPGNLTFISIVRTILSDMESLIKMNDNDVEKEYIFNVLISMYENLSTLHPSDLSYLAKLAELNEGMIILLINAGRLADARSKYDSTLDVLMDLLQKESDNVTFLSMIRTILSDMEYLLETDYSDTEREAELNVLISMYEKLSTLDPSDLSYHAKLAELNDRMIILLLTTGRLDEACSKCDSTLDVLMDLVQKEPDNVTFLSMIHTILNDMESLFETEGDASKKEADVNFLISMYEKLSTLDPSDLSYHAKIAGLNEGMIILLINAGRLDDARSRSDSTLDVLMDLVQKEPDNVTFLSMIHTILNDMESLFETEGDASKKEADVTFLISMYEKLSTLDPSDLSYHAKIAGLNEGMIILLINAGRLDDARSRSDSTLDVLMDLVQKEPDNVTFLSMIHTILNDMESLFETEGDASKKEADVNFLISMYEKLSTLDPSDLSYHAKIAGLNEGMIILLINAGRLDDARSRSDSTLDVLMDLVQKEPDNVTFLSMIHTILNDMESLFETEGDASKKEADVNFLISMYEKLSTLDPSDLSYHAKIAGLNEGMIILLINAGRLDDARSRSDSTLDVLMDLVQKEPDNVTFLSMIHTILTDLESLLDTEFDASKKESDLNFLISMYEKLSTLVPSDLSYHIKIVELNEPMIGLLMNAGLIDDVRSRYGSILNILMKLMEEEPENVTFISMFRNVLSDMESLLEIDCDDSEKEADLNVLISMYEKLSLLDPSDLSHHAKVADLYDRMGSFLMNAGRNVDARSSYDMSLSIRNILIEKGESPMLQEFGIASIRNNLGTMFAQDGEFAEAKAMFEASLKTYVDLFDRDKEDAAYQYGAALTLNNLAKLFADMGRDEDAKSIYESALEAYVELLNADPENVRYKKHASITLDNLGSLLGEMGRGEDSIRMHEAAQELRSEI